MSDPRPNYAIHQTDLFYNGATGNRDKIKLDINCLSRCHLFETEEITVSSIFGMEENFKVRILSEYELFGAKLKALLERSTPRDIFDAYMLEQKDLYKDEKSVLSIRKCLAYYLSLSQGVDIDNSIGNIRNRPIRDFKRQLFPMLKSGYGYVDREFMTSEAIKCVSRYLSFTDNELQYLDMAKKGFYCPELLVDEASVERISENPSAKFYITHNKL